MKKYILVAFFMISLSAIQAQNKINWRTFEEVEKLQKTTPKPVLIDTYTSWCGWCKHLDKTTFKNTEVINTLNTHFYAIKFDAETKDTITFLDGKKYINTRALSGKSSRSPHDLAVQLLQGKMSYPSMVIIDKERKYPHVIGGFKDNIGLMSYLLMYQNDLYKSTNVQEFEFFFNQTFKEKTLKQCKNKKEINWMTADEAFKANQKDTSKQILIQLYIDKNPICRTMDSTTFKNEVIVDYINQNFYPVKFNIFSDEVFKLGSTEFKQSSQPNKIHEFVLQLPRNGNRIVVPHTYVIKKAGVLSNRAAQFMTPQLMEVWLDYLTQVNNHKTKLIFQEYAKSFQYKVNYEQDPSTKSKK